MVQVSAIEYLHVSGVWEARAPPLERLALDVKRWLKCMRDAGRMIGAAVGSAASLAREAARRKSKWVVNPLPVYVDSRER